MASPPIFLAGVGPRMVEMVGEVADGFFVHPLPLRALFMDADTLPALRRRPRARGPQAR